MLNSAQRTSQILSCLFVMAMTLITKSPTSAQDNTSVNERQKSQALDINTSEEIIDFVNWLDSDNVKFGFLNHDFGFDSCFPDSDKEPENFEEFKEYRLMKDLNISEFGQLNNAD